MSRYDGLIIPRSYSEYLNKTDSATLSQMLQHLTGLWSHAVSAGDQKPVTSNAVYDSISGLNPVDVVQSGNMRAVTSNAVAKSVSDVLNDVKEYVRKSNELSPIETITLTTTNQTAQYDGVLFVYIVGTTQTEILVNGATVYVCQVPDTYDCTAVIPLCKGDAFRVTDTTSIVWTRARWYKNR